MSITSELKKARAAKRAIEYAMTKQGVPPTGLPFCDWPALVSQIGGDATALQTKTAIPAATDVTVEPDDGIAGLLQVLIEADINHKPYNIMDGITIHGVTGTAKPYVVTDGTWPFPSTDIEPGPHDPPTEEEVDNAVKEDDPEVNTEDKMVLAQNDGNITVGYLYTEEDSGLMVYGGAVLPGIDSVYTDAVKAEYPYLYAFKSVFGSYLLVATAKSLFVCDTDGSGLNALGRADDSGASVAIDVSVWKCIMPSEQTIGEPQEYWTFEYEQNTAGLGFGLDDLVWCNTDIYRESDGSLAHAADADPTEYDGFQITAYDPTTTEFRAVGWRRVSKHTNGEDAGKITRDNFTRQESGGWNYLKNIRSCTREKLYYKGVEVWPNNLYAAKCSYNGIVLPALPDWDKETYPYVLIQYLEFGPYYTVSVYIMKEPDIYNADDDPSRPCVRLTRENVLNSLSESTESRESIPAFPKFKPITYDTNLRFDAVSWANFDLVTLDGTLYLAASTPIPV